MSRFLKPNASRASRQRAIARGRAEHVGAQAYIDPRYEAKKTRRKIARASRKANR